MISHIHPSANLKLRYPIAVRATLLLTILILIVLALVVPRYEAKSVPQREIRVEIENVDVPPTEQLELPPPPARPSIPIESESIDLDEDATILETTLDDFKAWDVPPPPSTDGPGIPFIPYDEAPVPIGGYAAIQRNLIYPPIAQEAGIEGMVTVHAFIDANGIVTKTMILKGMPNTGLDEAAVAAIKKTHFEPAKQRDRAVGVWISIPVNFKLKG